mgnify:CR=1 FL=1
MGQGVPLLRRDALDPRQSLPDGGAVAEHRHRLVRVGGGDAADELLRELPGMAQAQIYHIPLPELPGLEQDGSYGEVAMEKTDWKLRNRDYVKQILQYRPEAVYVEGDVFSAYPVVHLLRKKHVPVLAMAERGGERILVRIPSGS